MAAATVSPDANKALCRRFVDDVFNKHDVGAIARHVSADYVDHDLPPGLPNNRQGSEAFFTTVFQGFPDVTMKVLAEYADGDTVIHRWHCTGTHKGEFLEQPPTNKRCEVDGIDIYRCANGKVVEHWGQWDAYGLLHQLRGSIQR